MYSLPQEIEVWYIIPALRKEFSRQLVQRHKLTLDKAGDIIGVSKAAVSQYLNNKRADKFKLPKNIKKEVETSAKLLIAQPECAVREMLRILKVLKKTGCECEICKKYNKGILKHCKMSPLSEE